MLRMGLLEISTPELMARDLRRDGQHRHSTAMAIVEPVDQVQIARATASDTDRQLSGEMGLGSGGERRRLLVADGDPLHGFAATNRIGDSVQRVARDTVDSLDAVCGERVDQRIRYPLTHRGSLLGAARTRTVTTLTPETM